MLADVAAAAPATVGRPARMVIARHSVRRSLRSGVGWGYVFGVVVSSSALSYGRIYKTAAERQRLAATFGANHASNALFGPTPQLQTVAGFTVFKVSMLLIIIRAIWGLLTSTRLLRGEEDAGRWELLLSGPDTNGRAVAQVLSGVGVGVGVMWAITAVLTVAVGHSSTVGFGVTASLYFALAMVASAVEFLAVGAVMSQLVPNRRQAAGYAAAFLGGEVNATRAEEAEGRLDHVLAAPVSRSRWFAGRLLVGIAALCLSGIAAGIFTWIGEAAQGGGVNFPTALDAGINVIPPALFALGIGALAVGFWPRRAGIVVYVVLGWSAGIQFAGGFAAQNHGLLDTSLFHQMASAPAVPPDWQVNGILTGLGLAAMFLGERALRHRDLQGE